MPAAKSSFVTLGPWPKGVQNVNDPTATPPQCLLGANNVYIDSNGNISPRLGYAPVTTDVHSLFRYANRVYGVHNGIVSEILPAGVRHMYGPGVGKLGWGVLNDEPVFVGQDLIGRISNGSVALIGVENPGAFTSLLTSGSFRLAVSFVSSYGEESAVTPSVAVAVGTTVSLPRPMESTVAKIRVYQTKSEGDILYRVTEVPAATSSYVVTDNPEYGVKIDAQYKDRIPGGSYVRYWRGRLAVARGRTLIVSEPMRYGLYDKAAGVYPFEAKIDWIESVETGLYVAVAGVGVYFLAGDRPDKWERKLADTIVAQPGCVLAVPTAQMKLDMQFPPNWVAVWLTSKGFALGLPTGIIIYPQNDELAGLPLGTGSLQFEGDRLIALSQ